MIDNTGKKTAATQTALLAQDDLPPFSVINEEGAAPCLLICEHASNRIPQSLGSLGLADSDLQKHIAWDIGTDKVTRVLSGILGAPAILANYSRLIVDLNRRLDHPTAFVKSAENGDIPANVNMTEEERSLREEEIYHPFHQGIESLLEGFKARDIVPMVISIHSFSRRFYNYERPWEIGVLWVQDKRLPAQIMDFFEKKGFTVGDNEPYDAKIIRGTAINHHADGRALPNALIEIRNDLIEDDEKAAQWAEMLGDAIKPLLGIPEMHKLYDGPQEPHDPSREKIYFDELIEKARRGE